MHHSEWFPRALVELSSCYLEGRQRSTGFLCWAMFSVSSYKAWNTKYEGWFERGVKEAEVGLRRFYRSRKDESKWYYLGLIERSPMTLCVVQREGYKLKATNVCGKNKQTCIHICSLGNALHACACAVSYCMPCAPGSVVFWPVLNFTPSKEQSAVHGAEQPRRNCVVNTDAAHALLLPSAPRVFGIKYGVNQYLV